jgi:hypothetical protein
MDRTVDEILQRLQVAMNAETETKIERDPSGRIAGVRRRVIGPRTRQQDGEVQALRERVAQLQRELRMSREKEKQYRIELRRLARKIPDGPPDDPDEYQLMDDGADDAVLDDAAAMRITARAK